MAACLGTAYAPVQQPAFQPGAFQSGAFAGADFTAPAPGAPGAALAGAMCAGNTLVGGAAVASQIEIVVHLNESPSYSGGAQTPFLAGRIFAGMPISCPPDIAPLQCLMERIAPAHVTVNYVTD